LTSLTPPPTSSPRVRRSAAGGPAASTALCLLAALAAAITAGCRERTAGSGPAPADVPTGAPAAAPAAGPVRRVVTLTPSATELVAAVGATDLLVGVDRFSTHPERVRDLPRVGDFLHPSFEAIVALAPDLVIADEVQAEVASGLNAAGIRTLTLSMHTIADVRTGLAAVGRALDREAAAQAAQAEIERALASARSRAQAQSREPPRVLGVVDRELGGLGNLVAAGPGSYLDELLAVVGAQNALADYRVRYPRLSAEQILRAQPEIILDLAPAAAPDTGRADWNRLPELPAVQHGRVHVLKDGIYLAPGPRIGQAIESLSAIVHGSEPGAGKRID
jgi:iron complex transport system substrate-binding protein